jgi:DNA-binding transcriptional LysR family regulator
MQIRKLTEVIGLPLFEQVGRRVEPTEASRELYDACRKMFEILSNLEMKVADLKGLRKGRLRISVVTTAKYLAPEMLGEFSSTYPGIELVLKVTNRHNIIERMHANEDDLYIMGQAPVDELDVEANVFSPNPLVVMAPRDHHLVGRKNVTLEELAEEPYIVREPGSGIRDTTFRTFGAKGLRPNVRMELGSNEAIKHAVAGGLGISVLSLYTLALEGTDGPVAILDVEGFPILRNWYIMHPKEKELSLVAKTFLSFAIDYQSKFRARMLEMWPALKSVIEDEEKKPGKKAATNTDVAKKKKVVSRKKAKAKKSATGNK